MVYNLFASESFVGLSTIVILILTLPLAILMLKKYRSKKSLSYLFWGTGLSFFALGVLLEVLFAFNIYNQALIKVYLEAVALLVGFLAAGSIFMLKSKRIHLAYSIFFIAAGAFVAYTLLASKISNLITSHVVFGVLPLSVVLSSSVLTFPAAVIIAVIAAISYKKSGSIKMISIITGVIVVSIAGTLYILAFPAFLYYSEFVGILLLWFGFI